MVLSPLFIKCNVLLFKVVKCHDHVELLINSGGDLLFWRLVLDIFCGAPSVQYLCLYHCSFYFKLFCINQLIRSFILIPRITCFNFRHHNEPWIPTLRLLHQFPFLLPPQMVDKGAIKFVLSGANIMCPGDFLKPQQDL